MLSDPDFLRYSRQIMLPICGESGIQSLAEARVAIVGLGGLGSIVTPYLASAGVGYLRLCDGDNISLSNLPRQWLYQQNEVREKKVSAMAARLNTMHAATEVATVTRHIDTDNVAFLLDNVDLVLDCTDNMTIRQLLNAHAMATGIPLVTAAAIGLQAQSAAFHPDHCGPQAQAGCYRCLYPMDELRAGNCQSEGVLGPIVGMAACYQAALALRILLGDSQVQWSRLWRLDSTHFDQQMLHIAHDPACPVCSKRSQASQFQHSASTG